MKTNQTSILVVEDDKAIWEDLKEVFKPSPQFHLTFAESGEKGYSLLMRYEPDIAIVDLGLPKMSGRQLIKDARKNGFKNAIIVLTANTEDSSICDNINGGADEYITKPYDHGVLMAFVNKVLRYMSTTTDPIIRFDKFVFDTYHHTISAEGGKKFSLSEHESKVLEVMLRSKQQRLDYETLIKRAWGDEMAVQMLTLSRTVDRLNEEFRDAGFDNVILKLDGREYYELARR